MALNSPYHTIIVESFYPSSTAGLHGPVHIRPAHDQIFPQTLMVECPKVLVDTRRHPVGTRFRLRVKLTNRLGSGEFLYNSYHWPYEVVSEEEFNRLHPLARARKSRRAT